MRSVLVKLLVLNECLNGCGLNVSIISIRILVGNAAMFKLADDRGILMSTSRILIIFVMIWNIFSRFKNVDKSKRAFCLKFCFANPNRVTIS